MRVAIEIARVYRSKSSGKRLFTKRAAYNHEACALIRKHCYCESAGPEDDYPGGLCHYHENDAYSRKLQARLIRFLMFLDKRGGAT